MKPLKLKGKKVTPSIIGTLDHHTLPLGCYVGLKLKQKISLINEGGFLKADPHLRSLYHLANLRPATLGEVVAFISDGEIFVLESSKDSVSQSSFKEFTSSIKEEELESLSSIWIPGVFNLSDYVSRGFINLDNKEIVFENWRSNLLLPSKISFESRYKFNSQTIKFHVKGIE